MELRELLSKIKKGESETIEFKVNFCDEAAELVTTRVDTGK